MGTTPQKQFLGGSQTILLHKERGFRGGRPPPVPIYAPNLQGQQ